MKNVRRTLRNVVLILVAVTGLTLTSGSTVQAGQTDLVGPAGSGSFGKSVEVLPNGNIVVLDPYYDAGSTVDVGAVYLYNGATGALISTLTGSTPADRIGSYGVMVLSNGNYLVRSPHWNAPGVSDAGAVTWGSGTTGVNGVVSSANSLVGSTADDWLGYTSVTELSNGNYVVGNQHWDNGGAADAGAATWGDGTTGVSGVVSSANSLVGSTAGDAIGYMITTLSNGNYVVRGTYWDNGGEADVGAVTWGDGTMGVSGVVSSTNSLVGSTTSDRVGHYVAGLGNGNYVVGSFYWNNGGATEAGAVTWVDGTTSISGVVSSANSLVGSTTGDQIGLNGMTILSDGDYLVRSFYWDNGGAVNAGAVTWGSGTAGVSGAISSANSLVGSTAGDQISSDGVTELSNGNYVVCSSDWNDGGTADVGAVTWGDGTTGTSGVISSANSLVGSTEEDRVGYSCVDELSNGNYLVRSPNWKAAGASDVGAVTWGSGTTGVSGVVSSANSLVGSTAGDRVGENWVVALSNGNYVVGSPDWDNGGTSDVGAVTWGNGATGTSGVVSSTNSLVGSTAGDQVGFGVLPLGSGPTADVGATTWGDGKTGIGDIASPANSLMGSTAGDQVGDAVSRLGNGNYVVISPYWDNGGAVDAGAVTWGNGTTGTSGVVSSANSLVGSTAGDQVGGVATLYHGNYVVCSPNWDNGGTADIGAVTWGDGTTGTSGVVSSASSLVGSTAGDRVGSGSVEALHNGNYVVRSLEWHNGGAAGAGAVTWGNGAAGTSGVVSSTNSLVGSTAGDQVGYFVTELSNGNYLVRSRYWDNGGAADAGAVTWGNGTTGTSGVVSSANSLVGSTAGDQIGSSYVPTLSNGNYVVRSSSWDNGGAVDAGAVTWGNGATGTSGAITAENSVRGTAAGGGSSLVWAYDDTNSQLVVGRPADNIVTLFAAGDYRVYLPLVLRSY